jgi:hypothetical protein
MYYKRNPNITAKIIYLDDIIFVIPLKSHFDIVQTIHLCVNQRATQNLIKNPKYFTDYSEQTAAIIQFVPIEIGHARLVVVQRTL